MVDHHTKYCLLLPVAIHALFLLWERSLQLLEIQLIISMAPLDFGTLGSKPTTSLSAPSALYSMLVTVPIENFLWGFRKCPTTNWASAYSFLELFLAV